MRLWIKKFATLCVTTYVLSAHLPIKVFHTVSLGQPASGRGTKDYAIVALASSWDVGEVPYFCSGRIVCDCSSQGLGILSGNYYLQISNVTLYREVRNTHRN